MVEEKRGRGRPKKDNSQVKNINIRISAELHAQISKAADRDRRTVSDWLRVLAMDAIQKSKP